MQPSDPQPNKKTPIGEVVEAEIVNSEVIVDAEVVSLGAENSIPPQNAGESRPVNFFFEDRKPVEAANALRNNAADTSPVVEDGALVESPPVSDAIVEAVFVEAEALEEKESTEVVEFNTVGSSQNSLANGQAATQSSDEFNATESDEFNATAVRQTDAGHQTDAVVKRSWVFRVLGAFSLFASRLFGIASVIFLLAVAANIPLIQLISFGYLLEVTGRLARKQKFRDAMIGLEKASVLGGVVLGTWLVLLPIRFFSGLWYEAYLIDPTSTQTLVMRILQIGFMGFAVAHIASAWLCGGKLRYFFWPVIAPFSIAMWLTRKVAGASLFRKILSVLIGWISPSLVDDVCNVKPMTDWFVPAIMWKRIGGGNLYVKSRDGVWDFAISLNLWYYFKLGGKGFIGTLLWLILPTTLLVVASFTEGALAILTGVFGVLFAIPIFMMLPFMQAHFAKDGNLKSFLDVVGVFKNYGRAPVAHIVALLLTLVLALPLFFLKIEQIPSELLWTLSIVFVIFSWPARMIVGWAYRRGENREKSSRWWVRYPLVLFAMPIALSFALILTLTRYVSWYGALSLFENHVFLLPAPFWI